MQKKKKKNLENTDNVLGAAATTEAKAIFFGNFSVENLLQTRGGGLISLTHNILNANASWWRIPDRTSLPAGC